MLICGLNLQIHDDLDILYGDHPYLWEQSITIRNVDCYCKFPYAECWENSAESFISGCETDNFYPQDITVDIMSKWRKARIDDVQVIVSSSTLLHQRAASLSCLQLLCSAWLQVYIREKQDQSHPTHHSRITLSPYDLDSANDLPSTKYCINSACIRHRAFGCKKLF
jgi:hypothetical protein